MKPMSCAPEQESALARLVSYFEAEHGSLGGWVRDSMLAAASWAPGFAGLVLRAGWSRLWIKGSGVPAIEGGVRILGAGHLTIDEGVYLDRGVYLHARPGGLRLGARTRVMSGAVLHVYNFRGLPNAGIEVGRDCVIGMNSVITGQGGTAIEDDVIIAPGAMVLPVNHLHDRPGLPVRDQGISAKGIRIKRGAWIGAGAVILDGVTVGENAVVGAGSVVTRDVGPSQKVAGNPAAPVKDRGGVESAGMGGAG